MFPFTVQKGIYERTITYNNTAVTYSIKLQTFEDAIVTFGDKIVTIGEQHLYLKHTNHSFSFHTTIE